MLTVTGISNLRSAHEFESSVRDIAELSATAPTTIQRLPDRDHRADGLITEMWRDCKEING